MKKINIISKTLLLVIFIIGIQKNAHSSNIGIAAIVNDDIISVYDVKARLHIITSTSGIKNNQETVKKLIPQIVRELVNEKLKIQEAEKENISITQEDLESTYKNIENINKIPNGKLLQTLAKLNIDLDSYNDQLKSKIAWAKLIQKKLRRSVSIGDEEINEKLKKIKENVGKPSMFVYEIFIPIDDSNNQEQAYNLALKIKNHINQGASFQMLARQFSKSATAAKGGNLGWIYKGQLEKELNKELQTLNVGVVSNPILTKTGYYILFLKDKTILKEFDKEKTQYKISQIYIPNNISIKEQSLIKEATLKVNNSCEKLNNIAKDFSLKNSGSLGHVMINKAPTDIKNALTGLDKLELSQPIKMKDGTAYIMICDINIPSAIPTKEIIKNDLRNKRLDQLAKNMLHNIRRASIIEFRK